MAERRMFSKKIISSARFLKMPSETQNLYFHLGINADDDGVVEAYNIMRLVGATEDSLKLLMAKEFIKILNDDLVSHVIDWHEHNKIRADRKVDSIYKDLLLQVVPDVELIEPRQRTDRQHKTALEHIVDSGTSHGPQVDRIGKDRLGKDRLVEDSKEYFEATEVATYLAHRIISYKPNSKVNPNSWVKDIERAIRIDKRSKDDLIALIDFIYEVDTFWIANILSGKKLRDKYDTIDLKMKATQPKQQLSAVEAMKQRLKNAQQHS